MVAIDMAPILPDLKLVSVPEYRNLYGIQIPADKSTTDYHSYLMLPPNSVDFVPFSQMNEEYF
jgi:hypothetical protein